MITDHLPIVDLFEKRPLCTLPSSIGDFCLFLNLIPDLNIFQENSFSFVLQNVDLDMNIVREEQ